MIATLSLSAILLILSLTGNANGQQCSNSPAYTACSTNNVCGCLLYSFSDTMGVCGDVSASCSQFAPCQSPNDACAQSGYVCVRHTNCDSRPLCYPLSMTDDSVCPSVKVSNYSNVLTTNSATYTRYGVASGTFYYHAIEVRVNRTGDYTFGTSSTIGDTFGYLYQGNFYSSYPQYNLITQDDDASGSNQFRISATLRADITYILVFTTYNQLERGSFEVSASGPGYAYLNPISP